MPQVEVAGCGGEEGQEDEAAHTEGEAEGETEDREPHEQVAQEVAEESRTSLRATLDEGSRWAGEEAVEVCGGGEAGYEEGYPRGGNAPGEGKPHADDGTHTEAYGGEQ